MTYEPVPTYLANGLADARVRAAMGLAVQTRTNPLPNVARRQVLRTNPKGTKTECVFADGTAILVSNFLASFIRAGNELRFPVELEAADAGTQIYIRSTSSQRKNAGRIFRLRSATPHSPGKTSKGICSFRQKWLAVVSGSLQSICVARR